jgi:nucleoid-associated protein YgaU
MNSNCPVCGQAGLSDYKAQHTICPQCDSDLKPYLLLHSISKKQNKNGINNPLVYTLLACCLLLAFFLLKNTRDYSQNLADNNEKIQMLQDSISLYKNNANSTVLVSDKQQTEVRETVIVHTIKNGDCMWKIARLYYGKGSLYKQIEKDNNLKKPYSLRKGQMLNIKLIQAQ